MVELKVLVTHTIYFWACSSGWLERISDKDEVRGASPRRPTFAAAKEIGALAQLGERLICIQEVIGSIPVSSTDFFAF